MLAAVIGLAAAAVAATVPTELAAAVPEAPGATNGATQLDKKSGQKIRGQTQRVGLLKSRFSLLSLASKVINPGGPGVADHRLKWRIWQFVVANYFSTSFIAREFLEFDWAVGGVRAVVFV